MAYTKYSLTPANNTAAPPDGAPEGMLPSAVNDTMRDMMAQIRDVGDGIRGGTYTMTAPIITGGTITGATVTSNTFSSSGATITGGSINGTTIGATTASTGAFSTLSATGVTTVQAGTVSAPAITTTGDTNTGIFFPAADTIAFTEGGTEAMRLTSAGDVGIGTTSPAQRLDVVTSGGNAYIRVARNAQSAGQVGLHINGGTSGTDWYIANFASTNDLSFFGNGSERMRIASDGLITTNIEGSATLYAAYSARAWVNFDGTAASNLTGTYSQTGTTVTVTITGHGYITGSSAYLDFTSGTAVDGAYTVTVTDANTFTVTQASRTTSGNVTSRRNTIRGSGNVSSVSDNGTGDYTVNFTTAMPDANYSAVFGGVRPTTNYFIGGASSFTTTCVNINTWSTTPAAVDYPTVCVSIFR